MNLEDLYTAVRRGGVEPTPRELAETLWLAAQMQRSRPEPASVRGDDPGAPAPPGRLPRPKGRPTSAGRPEPPPATELHPYRPAVRRTRPARAENVPRPIALSDRLAFQRALRPLLRRVPAPGPGTLDEEATARLIGDQPPGAPWPVVMRSARQRWLDAVVVVDDGDSMAIWRGLAADVVRVLRESGVFRQVTTFRLRPAPGDGTVAEVTDWQGRPVTPGHLVDPMNRRVTFVITDGVDPIWRSGSAGAVASGWARRGPMSILQPLPERLWARTWTRTVAGTLAAPRPAAPNSDLSLAPFGGRAAPDGVLVPVLQMDHRWLRRWTALIAGGPPMTAAVTGIGEPLEEPVTPAVEPLTPGQRVQRFRAAASPEAFRLARLVALSEPQVEVIRYVQQATFPDPQPAYLAEVLLSGLLRVENADLGQYGFIEGVAEELVDTLTVSETLGANELLAQVSVEVARQRNRTGAGFLALTPADGDERMASGSRPFAVTSYGRERVTLARRRLEAPPPAAPARPASRPVRPRVSSRGRLSCPYCYSAIRRRADLWFACTGRKQPGKEVCRPVVDEARRSLTGYAVPSRPVFPPPSTLLPFTGTSSTADCPDCGGPTGIRVCPHCHTRLPAVFGESASPMIAMVGARATGKSVYLTVLTHQMRSVLFREFDADVRQVGGDGSDWLDQNTRRLYEDRSLLATTARAFDGRTEAMVLEWRTRERTWLGQNRFRSSYISFQHGLGDDLTDDTYPGGSRYLGAASHLILLLDPTQLPGAAERLRLPVSGRPYIDPVRDVLNWVTETLKSTDHWNGRMITLPVAVVFTKMDAFYSALGKTHPLLLTQRRPGGYDEQHGRLVHELVSVFLDSWNGQDINRTLRANYRDYQYFFVSALGAEPNYENATVSPAGIRPERVEEPLLWLLHRAGVVPAAP
ncbi:hypothetical protein JIG36_35565 [Actinoplanes sp. LDG1-06]|uniref:Uncharacterized protein n=1 Tax=Paractinoplanes ovalisporus TaxID=2810368 RepID=A0ABS2ALU0_9ACTN|nr:SAV_2336 N-terminal domain-related protein [Actinoplanes ovalisporus]MBM2620832.1 hypothetical protein [Actinoplanes ovalisporus]